MSNPPCHSCTPTTNVGYAVQFQGSQNAKALSVWKQADRITMYHQIDETTIWLPESSLAEMIDYLKIHMDPSQLLALPMERGMTSQHGSWLSLEEVVFHHEAHWIDEVIAKERIQTFFQPIIAVQDGTVLVQGYELLSRALDDDGSFILPSRMFEAARLRHRLFALDRVCRVQAVRNASQVAQDKLVFVNFIPTAIYSPEHCLQTTLEEAKRTGANPNNFVFEVVESDKVDSISHLENILNYYRKHGFRYALDDVGQGYSTLEMVERLRPDFVKLDMHYVHGVHQDKVKQQATLDLLHVARKVGSIPLAEGVETKQDWHWLLDAGFELFQGYLFGRPDPTVCQSIDVKLV